MSKVQSLFDRVKKIVTVEIRAVFSGDKNQ